jgi:amino acid adenylation domain-containing protein
LRMIELCGENPVWGGEEESNPARAAGLSAESLAYVIYTSGSTGRPKGVMVAHQNLVNYVLGTAKFLPAPPLDSTVFSPISFDLTNTSLYPPLMHGGCVTLISSFLDAGIHGFMEEFEKNPNRLVKLTPSHLRTLLATCQGNIADRPVLVVGGETLTYGIVQDWKNLFPQSVIINHYGPTETTVGACTYLIPATGIPDTIPIGKPIGNARIYILDEEWEPVPVGVAGEIHIGGDGVGRGYLKRPELTAERFVADRFSGEEGTRMYRTGDVGRWRGDGNIEFLGRNDEQVKIRGFRIELGEIEARLSEHEGVQEAVVLAREDMPGDKRLVAYYTSSPVADTEQEGVGAEQLRVHLSATLPEYMVPAAYVRMERMPLTANGKLDRKSLPAPDGLPSRNARSFRTAEEQILCSLFAEVLNVEDVGVDDNFFESGGHSLSAIRLVTRIRSELGLNISLRTLLEAPTVAGLAKLKNVETNRDSFATILPIKARGTLPPLFLVHAASGLSWYYAGLLKYVEPERPIYGLQARNFTAPEISEQTVEEMASYYADEILKVQPTGRYHLGGWSIGGLLAHAIATELQRRGGDVALLSLFDPTPPFIQQNRPNAVFPNETRIA